MNINILFCFSPFQMTQIEKHTEAEAKKSGINYKVIGCSASKESDQVPDIRSTDYHLMGFLQR